MQTRDEIINEFNELRDQMQKFSNATSFPIKQQTHKGKQKTKRQHTNNKKQVPIFINQLTPNTVHSNKQLIGKIIVDPLKLSAIHFVIEDDFEVVVGVSVYSENQINKYQKGTKVCINNPYYKIAGDGKYQIRIDEPSKGIQILSETTSIGKAKSAIDWKNIGNKCFQTKNYKYSNQCYSRGISYYQNLQSNSIITSLLNNRSLCYIKMNKFKLAFMDIIASKYIDKNVYKTWQREILCLIKLNQQNVAFAVWKEAMKLFSNNKKELKTLKKQLFAKKLTVKYDDIIEAEWNALGIIVNDILISNKFENKFLTLSANGLKESGNKEFHANNYVKAIEYYSIAIMRYYKNISVLLSNRAASLIYLKEHRNAFKDATISVIIDPNNIKGWFRRTIMSFQLNLFEIGNNICQIYDNNKNDIFTNLMKKFRSDQNKNKKFRSDRKSNDEYLNNEEKKIEMEQKIQNSMSNSELSMMNILFSSLPAKARAQMGFIEVPKFHKLLPQRRNYPKGSNKNKCDEILSGAYEHARSMGMHTWHILSEKFQVTEYDILKRLASPNRLEWYHSAKPGIVDDKWYDEMIGYDSGACHSFSNTPDNNIIIYSGQTHIAIGFCDLGLLAKCTIKPSNKQGIVKFIGVDMSAHSIAKAYVINEMLKMKNISNESILEVWYSVTWTKETKKDFNNILTDIILKTENKKMEKEVYEYIKHWCNSKGVSVKTARKLWINSLTDVFAEIASFNKINDVLDYAQYIISGDIMRENGKSLCGNVTMFDNIKSCPKKAKNENIYQILEMNELFAKSWKEMKSLKQTVRFILTQNIKQLKDWIINKEVVIQFIYGQIGFNNTQLIQILSDMKPYSVSWSNCIDYIHPTKFHNMAKYIGNEDCVHFAYTMNWMYSMNGCNIIDYTKVDIRKQLFEASKEAIKMVWNSTGIDEILKFPPIDHPINVASYGMVAIFGKKWVKWFLSEQVAKYHVHYNKDSIIPMLYSPLHRSTTVINFVWTYDKTLNLLPPSHVIS